MIHWVLIRGLGRQQGHWRIFPELLKNQIGGKIHFIDLPGFGQNTHLKAPLSIAECSNFLHSSLEKIKNDPDYIAGPCVLIAVSLGGMVAMDWVNRYPNDFQHFITINTSAGNLSPLFDRLRPEGFKTLLHLFLRGGNVRYREESILKLTTSLSEISDPLIHEWVEIDHRHPLTRGAFLRQLFAAATFKIPDNLPIHPLILCSAKDRLVHPNCSIKLAEALKQPVAIHPTAGHDLPLDDPSWIIQQIKSANW